METLFQRGEVKVLFFCAIVSTVIHTRAKTSEEMRISSPNTKLGVVFEGNKIQDLLRESNPVPPQNASYLCGLRLLPIGYRGFL